MAYLRKKDQAANWKRWYKKNRKKHISNSKRREQIKRKEIRSVLNELKNNKLCADCGVSYPYWIMQFDHVRGKKLCDVSNMGTHGYSLKSVLKEVKKCDLVCANCHSTRTHNRRARGSNGKTQPLQG